MKQLFHICWLLIFFLSFEVFAQERDLKKLTIQKRHQVVQALIQKGSYYNAIDELKNFVSEFPEERDFSYKLAEAYFFSRDYQNAEQWYTKSIELDGKVATLALFRYAESLKYNGKYKEAKGAFENFVNSNFRESRNDKYKSIAKHEIESCEFAIKEMNASVFADVTSLGNNINSAYSEFSPIQQDASTLIFASLKADSVLFVKNGEAHYYRTKLFSAKENNGEWSALSEITALNSTLENTANGSFSPDKSKFYFTRCRENRNHEMVCQIYVSKIKEGEFQEPEKLDGFINLEGYTFTQPHSIFTGKGKSQMEVLYFVSNLPGGKGGLDIWYTTIEKDATCKKPVNLGMKINTIRDEISPFYDSDSSALYFSSNYHFGFGGFDIFKTFGKLTKWEEPTNLGVPINSSVDDVYFTIKPNKKEAFLVSNRVGGINLKSPTCCDDIYTMSYKPITLVALNIFDRTEKNKRITNVKAYLMSTLDSIEVKDPIDSTKRFMVAQFDTVPVYLNKNPLPIKTDDVQYFYRPSMEKMYSLRVEVPGGEAIEMQITGKTNEEFEFDAKNDSLFLVNNYKDDKINILVVNAYVKPDSIIIQPTVTMKEDTVKVSLDEEGSNLRDKVLHDNNYSTIGDIIESKKLDKKSLTNIEFTVILNFDFDASNFIFVNEGSLDSLVNLMKNYEDLQMEISAHTDSSGTAAYNLHLSKKRATVIENYFRAKGISKKRLIAQGFGFTKPIAPNFNTDGSDNEEGRALNRRAEIKIRK